MPRSLLTIPLVPLAVLGACLTALGLSDVWHWHTHSTPDLPSAIVIAAALHAAWVVPAVLGRQRFLTAAGWLVTVGFCRTGLRASGFDSSAGWYALVLESIVLAIACGHGASIPWSERLAAWRRSRERIATEVRMGEGLLPWSRAVLARVFTGRADRPVSSAFQHVAAELADADDRMRQSIAALALPDAAADVMRTAVRTIATRAEATAAELAIVVERVALEQAAACRDAIARLKDLPAADRERIGGACESLLLDLAHGAHGHRRVAEKARV